MISFSYYYAYQIVRWIPWWFKTFSILWLCSLLFLYVYFFHGHWFWQIKSSRAKFMKLLDALMEDLELLQLFQFIIWFAFSHFWDYFVNMQIVPFHTWNSAQLRSLFYWFSTEVLYFICISCTKKRLCFCCFRYFFTKMCFLGVVYLDIEIPCSPIQQLALDIDK